MPFIRTEVPDSMPFERRQKVAMGIHQALVDSIGMPADEFFKLGEWFDDQRERLWDERIARDAKSGRLDFLIDEARAARESGTLRPFP